MSRKKLPRINKSELSTSRLCFLAWCEAAEAWRRLRSDPAEARCRAARADYYMAVYGVVPPLAATVGSENAA